MEFFEKYKNDMLTYVKTRLDAFDAAGNPRKLAEDFVYAYREDLREGLKVELAV